MLAIIEYHFTVGDMANPYDNPEFARSYAMGQLDPSRNKYEWQVSHPALLQFLTAPNLDRVLDYGCGTGVFTAGMARFANAQNPTGQTTEFIGTDASTEMLKYAATIGQRVDNLTFKPWDAATTDSDLPSRSVDRVMSKLTLQYLSQDDLQHGAFPRFYDLLKDDGLLVALLPNPLREMAYSKEQYQTAQTIDIEVGSFGDDQATEAFHHTHESLQTIAQESGFHSSTVLGLPEVRFVDYKPSIFNKSREVMVAHPMPLVLSTLNNAKRWVYVFGKTPASTDAFVASLAQFKAWRQATFPEIADRAHILVPEAADDDVMLPLAAAGRQTLYDYIAPEHDRVLPVPGEQVENMSAADKVVLVKRLARLGLR